MKVDDIPIFSVVTGPSSFIIYHRLGAPKFLRILIEDFVALLRPAPERPSGELLDEPAGKFPEVLFETRRRLSTASLGMSIAFEQPFLLLMDSPPLHPKPSSLQANSWHKNAESYDAYLLLNGGFCSRFS